MDAPERDGTMYPRLNGFEILENIPDMAKPPDFKEHFGKPLARTHVSACIRQALDFIHDQKWPLAETLEHNYKALKFCIAQLVGHAFHTATFCNYMDHMLLKSWAEDNVRRIHDWLLGPLMAAIQILQDLIESITKNVQLLKDRLDVLTLSHKEVLFHAHQMQDEIDSLRKELHSVRLQMHVGANSQSRPVCPSDGGRSAVSIAETIRSCQQQAYSVRGTGSSAVEYAVANSKPSQ